MSTLLYLAVIGGDLEIVKMLIEYDVNIEVKNVFQEILFYRVVQFNRVEIVDFFFSK